MGLGELAGIVVLVLLTGAFLFVFGLLMLVSFAVSASAADVKPRKPMIAELTNADLDALRSLPERWPERFVISRGEHYQALLARHPGAQNPEEWHPATASVIYVFRYRPSDDGGFGLDDGPGVGFSEVGPWVLLGALIDAHGAEYDLRYVDGQADRESAHEASVDFRDDEHGAPLPGIALLRALTNPSDR